MVLTFKMALKFGHCLNFCINFPLKHQEKNVSENVLCLSRLLQIIAYYY